MVSLHSEARATDRDPSSAPGGDESDLLLRTPDAERKLLLMFVLLAAALRVLFLLISENATSDGPPRAIRASEWASDPVLVTHGHWLPLQIYLSGLLLMVWPDMWVAPRIVSLAFGVATVWPFWRLMRLSFSLPVAAAACACFCLYGLHIAQSVVSSGEAIFLFLVLWAIHHFTKWWRDPTSRSLLLSGLFWLPATWTKPEAWWLTASCCLLTIGRAVVATRKGGTGAPRTVGSVVMFCALGALGPLLWLAACALFKGDAFFSFHRATLADVYFARPTWYKAAFWPVGLTLSLGPLLILSALLGVRKAVGRREHLLLLAFLAAFLLPFWTLQVLNLSGVNVRHSLFVGTLLLPFAPYALESAVRKPWPRLVRLALATGAAWLLVVIVLGEIGWGEVSQKFASISPRPRERPHVAAVTDWLRRTARQTDRIVVDHFNEEESSLQYQVRLPPHQVRIYWHAEQSLGDTFTPTPRYLVYAKTGALAKSLGLDWGAESQVKLGHRFHRRYVNPVYAVFETAPPEPSSQ